MSRLIKLDFYIPLTELKQIETPIFQPGRIEVNSENEDRSEELHELEMIKSQILNDAEEIAQQQINQAMAEAQSIKDQALLDIERWWQERRAGDEQHITEAQNNGYEAGYQHGLVEAEASVRASYAEMIQESQTVLNQAYGLKEDIIQEAEPFLIELSCSIAEKIIQRQLNLEPDWVVEYTQGILARRREKGLISICVAPNQFAFMQDAKDEFMLHIDSQAELQILPDATVSDHGCVIRSPFLSVDARIDTQLKEIKDALQLIAKRNESALDHE
ncbi:MAG: FliH/SctL family protein [Paenibacillaceae bacterium]